MNRIGLQRLVFVLSIFMAIFSSWDLKIVMFWKDFIVLSHEFFHAFVAVLTGGTVKGIILHGNESGQTITAGGWFFSFPIVYSAGYLGSSFLGGALLYSGFKENLGKITAISLGIFVTLSTLMFCNFSSYASYLGIFWGLGILFFGIITKRVSAILLISLGTAMSLYSIYDLMDLYKNTAQSDAGKLAHWIIKNFYGISDLNTGKVLELGYIISLVWTFISLAVILYFLKRVFFPIVPEERKSVEKILDHVRYGNVNEDVAEWFLQRGIDLDGRPLSTKIIDEIKEKGNYNE